MGLISEIVLISKCLIRPEIARFLEIAAGRVSKT